MNPIRILLVEDNPGDALLVEEILKETSGFSPSLTGTHIIEIASTLASGLDLLAHSEFDLVMLDLGLPDSQGLETLSMILTEHEDVPVIVLTSQQQEDMGINAVKMGAQDYLFKGHVEPYQMVSSIRYAIERSNLERQLRESEGRYRSLINDVLDTSDVGIFILDAGFRIVWVNQAAERFFGLRREDVIGMDNRVLLERQLCHLFDDTGAFYDRVNALYANNSSIESFECHMLGGENRDERWLLHWSQPIATGLYKGGRIEHYTDITAQKNVERALLIANRKLNLLSSVTRHDILNNVTALSLGGNRLLDRIVDPGDREYLSHMITEIQNIEQQIEFTRIYHDIGVKKPEWHCVESVAKAAFPLALKKHVSLRINTGNLEIFADSMLQRVLYNLFQNAFVHGKHVTEIRISSHLDGGQCTISVEDNGIGIVDDLKDVVFQHGFGSNTGFGLFLIKEILGITGISIQETGVAGRGARFEMTITCGMWRIDGEK